MRYVARVGVAAVLSGVAMAQPLPDDTNAIKTLTAAQALALAKHEGDLCLNGLNTLSDEAAKALIQHEGRLFLHGLTSLSGEQAKLLGQHKGALFFSGLTALSEEATTALAERLARRDTLMKKYKQAMAEIRSCLDNYNDLAATLGTTDSTEVATQRTLLLDHVGTLRDHRTQLQRNINEIDAELAVMDAKDRGENTLEQSVPDEIVDAMVLRDPQFVELSDRLAGLEEAIAYQAQRSGRGANDPAVKKLESMRGSLLARMEQRREEIKPQIVTQFSMEAAGKRTGAAAESPVVLRLRREILARQLEETSKDFDRVANEVKHLGQANADLMARRQEIDQLIRVTEEMGVRLDAMEIYLGHNGLTTLSDEQAKMLSQHEGALFLSGVTKLSDEAAGWLAQHEGDLFLNGLTALSDEQALSLGRHKGDVFLNGLTTLSREAASALIRANPDVWLPENFRR